MSSQFKTTREIIDDQFENKIEEHTLRKVYLHTARDDLLKYLDTKWFSESVVREAIRKERDICDKMATKVEGNDDFMFNQFKARILTCERLLQSLGLDGEQE